MRNVLLHLDSSFHASAFDRIVALDGGADEVLSYGGVTVDAVRELVHGAIFTRGPRDLRHTAIFIGGTDITVGENLLAAVRQTFFGPFSVSVMLDSNGSNTTAVAAVHKIRQAIGSIGLEGRRAVITAGTGPVGMRAAGLLGRRGAMVAITSRKPDRLPSVTDAIQKKFGTSVRPLVMPDRAQANAALEGAEIVLNTGPSGGCLVSRDAWWGREGLRVVADVNAVPPLGIEGIEVGDDGTDRDGVAAFGAISIGNLKMKIHKACIARLFERNDVVLDAESIDDLARDLASPKA
jgi:hypothetical protein